MGIGLISNPCQAEWQYLTTKIPNGIVHNLMSVDSDSFFSFICSNGDGPYARISFSADANSEFVDVGWSANGSPPKASKWKVFPDAGWNIQAISTKKDGIAIFDATKRSQSLDLFIKGAKFSYSSEGLHEPMVAFIQNCRL